MKKVKQYINLLAIIRKKKLAIISMEYDVNWGCSPNCINRKNRTKIARKMA